MFINFALCYVKNPATKETIAQAFIDNEEKSEEHVEEVFKRYVDKKFADFYEFGFRILLMRFDTTKYPEVSSAASLQKKINNNNDFLYQYCEFGAETYGMITKTDQGIELFKDSD